MAEGWARVRSVWSRPSARTRMAASVAAFAAICAVAAIIHPDFNQLRQWSLGLGPWFPVIFLLIHALVTISPFPRTVFTVSAALLFPVWGAVALSVGASTISAVLALWLIRGAARDLVTSHLHSQTWQRVHRRIERRGWLAVGSLRMIGALPFSLVNAAAAVSPVRVLPYALASLVGMLPGTIVVIMLTVGLTSGVNPIAVAVPFCFGALGILGLLVDMRMRVHDTHEAPTDPAGDPTSSADDADDAASAALQAPVGASPDLSIPRSDVPG